MRLRSRDYKIWPRNACAASISEFTYLVWILLTNLNEYAALNITFSNKKATTLFSLAAFVFSLQ
jgi:hypothetical protein